jgi:hypothetical protein
MVGEAHRKGYSVALTTIAPVRSWWRLWLRFYFGWLGPRLEKRGMRGVLTLSIVNAARWSLIEREPGTPSGGDGRLPRPYLLFEANFNGNTDHYLESFAMVSTGGLVAAWGCLGLGAYDVPSPWKVSRFITYVNDNRSHVLHHYCAYPEASTKVVRTALRLQELLAEFQAEAHRADTARFNRAWETLLEKVEEINDPPPPRRNGSTRSFTAMTPIKPGPLDEMQTAFEVLEHEPEHVPPTTHFARWSYVDSLKPPPRMKRDPTRYLIFSAWFDGPVEQYLLALYDGLGSARVNQIWGPCGFTGAGAAQLQRFLLNHVVHQGLPILAYDGVSVEEVLWALTIANRFDEASVELQAMRGDDLRAKLRQKGLLD